MYVILSNLRYLAGVDATLGTIAELYLPGYLSYELNSFILSATHSVNSFSFATIDFGLPCLRLVKGSPTTTVLKGLLIVGICAIVLGLKFHSILCFITPIVFLVVTPSQEDIKISLCISDLLRPKCKTIPSKA